jgi:hypothetical protein
MPEFYPPLPDDALWPLETLLARGFVGTDAPYSAGWMKVLSVLTGERKLENGEVDVAAEVRALFKELQDEKQNLKVKDNTEKMAYFRTATSLLEKLIGLQERANNVHQIGQFYGTVLAVMESELNVDQIHRVRAKLKVGAV